MATYAFQDCFVAIKGPGGSFSLGAGSANAEEGISITMLEDKDSMMMGADGAYMHSLHAGKGGMVSVSLLKTSPVNQLLMEMYNFQTMSSANHGENVISLRDVARGDSITCRGCAFKKAPDLKFAKEGGMNMWEWHAGIIDQKLGNGTPAL